MRALNATVQEFFYRPAGRFAGATDGSHRARRLGAGDDYFGSAPLHQGHDTRRLDLRQTMSDPFGRTWMREFRTRVNVPLIVIADLSGSMDFVGRSRRYVMLLDLVAVCARSAWRQGDPFGFIGCDDRVRRELHCPPSRGRTVAERAWSRLSLHVPQGDSAQGLRQAASWLPSRRCLVLLVSDMHLPERLLTAVLASLGRHDVHAIMLTDGTEHLPPRRWGLARLADLETGHDRLVWLRPGFEQRMERGYESRIAAFRSLCRRCGVESLVLEDRIDSALLTRHFLAGAR